MAYSSNSLTNTTESGTYYAGKNRADQAYGKVLSNQTYNPYTGQGVKAAQNAAALQAKSKANKGANPLIDAATAQVDADLQDEISAENALQAERTYQYAQSMANAPRTPGGSIRRGAGTTIGAATGSGLARANAEARRKAKLNEATTKVNAQMALQRGAALNDAMAKRNKNTFTGTPQDMSAYGLR